MTLDIKKRFIVYLSFLFFFQLLHINCVISQELIFSNVEKLAKRGAFSSNQKENNVLLERLIAKADSILKINYWPRVTNKKLTAVSNDIHDYVSMATYYWPNPKTANGLPYVGIDGKSNPEVAKINNYNNLVQVSQRVKTLGLAYFYTKNEKYAKSAAALVGVFFLRDDTKMNPNFNHAQFIKGKNTGRLEGIIEARFFIDLLQGVELLSNSKSFSKKHYSDLKVWFRAFLNWMETSSLGKKHGTLRNNIETSYNLQRIAYASFLGDKKKVNNIYQQALKPLIKEQFDLQGKQPLELKRSSSEQYSIANLKYWVDIENILLNMGINFDNEDQKIINNGVLYLSSLDLKKINKTHSRMLKSIMINKRNVFDQATYKSISNLVDNKSMDGSLDQLFLNLID